MHDRLDDLLRMRAVLFLALDGDRRLQRGEQDVYNEPAASLVRELRAVTKELAELGEQGEPDLEDQLAERRAQRDNRPDRGRQRRG